MRSAPALLLRSWCLVQFPVSGKMKHSSLVIIARGIDFELYSEVLAGQLRRLKLEANAL